MTGETPLAGQVETIPETPGESEIGGLGVTVEEAGDRAVFENFLDGAPDQRGD